MSVRAQARIGFSAIAREVSEFARSLVPTVGDDHLEAGELVVCSLRLRALSLALCDAAIRVERASGASWADVAAARRQDVDELRAEHPDADTFEAITEAVAEDLPRGLVEALADLDAWYKATARPQGEDAPPSRAVSQGLF